ncbi:PaaI family thioesterase [Anaerobacillus sp. MEB173]|uniref:PaaI family thioesterase n=1 Tax=Anaerobacillus sp. MEB173 TaxID=3383345 RepID=UPI003F910B6B
MSVPIHGRVKSLIEGPVWKHLNISVHFANEEQAKIELPVANELKQAYGVIHGGIISTVLDMAMSAALTTTLDDMEFSSTIDLHVSFLRPMFGKTLFGEAKVVKRGKRIIVVNGEAVDESGNVIATSTGHFMVLKRK